MLSRCAASAAGSSIGPAMRQLTMAATATAMEAAATATAMEAGMGKPAMEAAAESAVPTSATTPPAAPAPADIDPHGPPPTPARPTPAGRCPAWVPPTPARAPPTRTRVPNPAGVTGAPSPRIRCRGRVSRIALRRARGRWRRISRIGLRRHRGIAGIIGLCRGRRRGGPNQQGDGRKSSCGNGNAPEKAPLSANEHQCLHPVSPETNQQRAICICHSDCHLPRRCLPWKLSRCHKSPPQREPPLRPGRAGTAADAAAGTRHRDAGRR